MTHESFDTLFESTIAKLRELGKTKGREYANSTTDRLANFKEIGAEIGVSPLHVLLCYSKKHSRAIDNYCKSGGVSHSNESIESRIVDRILYDFLLLGLVEDQQSADDNIKLNDKATMPPVYVCECGEEFYHRGQYSYHRERCVGGAGGV